MGHRSFRRKSHKNHFKVAPNSQGGERGQVILSRKCWVTSTTIPANIYWAFNTSQSRVNGRDSSHFYLTTALWGRHCHYLQFPDGELEALRFKWLSQSTQPSRVQTQGLGFSFRQTSFPCLNSEMSLNRMRRKREKLFGNFWRLVQFLWLDCMGLRPRGIFIIRSPPELPNSVE